jgi:hypothetical protein
MFEVVIKYRRVLAEEAIDLCQARRDHRLLRLRKDCRGRPVGGRRMELINGSGLPLDGASVRRHLPNVYSRERRLATVTRGVQFANSVTD